MLNQLINNFLEESFQEIMRYRMQTYQEANQIVGKHRAKINAWQTPSEATLEYAKTITRHVLGPGEIAEREWAEAGLPLPDMDTVRSYRLNRVREQLRYHDLAGIILYDPLNVRYSTDSTNMQLWATHNACRYAFVPTEGPVIVFEFDHCDFLNGHSNVVDEVRKCKPWFYFAIGERIEEQAKNWADEIADLVKQYGGGNMRLALDRCNREGIMALAAHGLDLHNGERIMELAREIKSEEEIVAMRCAVEACARSMDVMREHLVPGVMEQELWGYLHAANITRGSEWIETRLLSSGPRTNPWYQECSSRKIENGDLMAFDTDLVGAYGSCVDISRTWLCGDKPPTPAQRDIYQRAHEQVIRNTEWLKPGLSYHDLTHQAYQYDPTEFRHYTCLYHGVGLCDEAPWIYFPASWESYGYDGHLEAGMVICVESYVGRQSGGPGVKLEDQILITETGHERLSLYPWEADLLTTHH